jgi:hypothetical protein
MDGRSGGADEAGDGLRFVPCGDRADHEAHTIDKAGCTTRCPGIESLVDQVRVVDELVSGRRVMTLGLIPSQATYDAAPVDAGR